MADAGWRSDGETEITPEMIEAGLHELAYYDPGEDSADFAAETVAAIWRAMDRARPLGMTLGSARAVSKQVPL
jgi:hypothetical protein